MWVFIMTQSFISDIVFMVALGIISTAFWLIASQNKIFNSARWFGVAFALAASAVILQKLSTGVQVWQFGRILYGFLGTSATVMAIIGVLAYYKAPINWKLVFGFLTVVLVANWFVQSVSTDIVLERAVIHIPNMLNHIFATYVVFSYGPRKTLEWILGGVIVFGVLFFLSNPIIVSIIHSIGGVNEVEALANFDWVWEAFGVVFGLSNGLLFILMFVRDMFARTRIDGLSGLLNRKTFEDEMDSLLYRTKAGKCAGSLVVADLDHFKQINDTYGHGQGDKVIVRFSELLLSCAVGDVIVGRLGGEEFGVFLPGCDLTSAQEFAQAICQVFHQEKFDVSGPQLLQSASFGVAEYSADEPVSGLFTRADVALYQAKVKGRNRVCVAAPPRKNTGAKHAGFVQKNPVAA